MTSVNAKEKILHWVYIKKTVQNRTLGQVALVNELSMHFYLVK